MKQKKNEASVRLHRSLIALLLQFLAVALLTYLCFFIVTALKTEGIFHSSAAKKLIWIYRSLCCLYFIELLRRYFNDILVFGKNRVIHLHGRFSTHLQKTSIAYSDIRETSVQQSLIGRALGYGTLQFGTAASDNLEIFFYDISCPKKLSHVVQEIITAHQRKAKHRGAQLQQGD